ncbi:MAG: hypothetical protein JRJ85_07395 [Deltaproteobacteria bacterium]|nr:hypothetical protein [Deltaproteobacteria bacterium]
MKNNDQVNDEEYSVEDLKRYMALSPEEKLNYLEEINLFFQESMPDKSKKVWEELKKQGW